MYIVERRCRDGIGRDGIYRQKEIVHPFIRSCLGERAHYIADAAENCFGTCSKSHIGLDWKSDSLGLNKNDHSILRWSSSKVYE